MACRLCLADPHPANFGQPRQCAFYERGGFRSDNWRCATLDALRSRLLWSFCDDSSIGIVRIPETNDKPEGFLVMTWHKMRGCVESAVVMGDYPGTRGFRIDVAELILAQE